MFSRNSKNTQNRDLSSGEIFNCPCQISISTTKNLQETDKNAFSTFHLSTFPVFNLSERFFRDPCRCVNLRHLRSYKVQRAKGDPKKTHSLSLSQQVNTHHVFLRNLFSFIPSLGQALGSGDLINGGGESQVFLSPFGTRPRLLQEWLARSVVPEPNRFLLPEFFSSRFFHKIFRQQRASINQRFLARNKCQSS